jgi:hypothetical protein
MLPLDHVLAIVLLMGSPGEPDPKLTSLDAMRDVCTSWQLMDPRECSFVLTRTDEWKVDLKMLRKRYDDLHDAPPFEDHVRFPDKDLITDLQSFNKQYRAYVEIYAAIDPRCAYDCQQIIEETDRLYEIWDKVRDASMPAYYLTVRRGALKDLRTMIGDKNYYAGNLPPCVPIWRFNHVD